LKSLSLGERTAAASGAALFVFLFVPWLEGRNAWKLFSWVDILLALLALIAVALPLLKAVGSEPAFRAPVGTILSRVGLIALTITAIFVIEGADRNITILLPLLATVGILYGGMTTPDEAAGHGRARGRREGTRGRGEAARRSYSSRDFEEPPPGMEDWRTGGRTWSSDFEEEPGASTRGGARDARVGEPGGRLGDEEGFPPERGASGGEPTEVREPRGSEGPRGPERRSPDEPQ